MLLLLGGLDKCPVDNHASKGSISIFHLLSILKSKAHILAFGRQSPRSLTSLTFGFRHHGRNQSCLWNECYKWHGPCRRSSTGDGWNSQHHNPHNASTVMGSRKGFSSRRVRKIKCKRMVCDQTRKPRWVSKTRLLQLLCTLYDGNWLQSVDFSFLPLPSVANAKLLEWLTKALALWWPFLLPTLFARYGVRWHIEKEASN